jgi:peptide/nickel transport system permease protein
VIFSYAARRIMQMIPVVVGMTLIVFLMIHLVPGDPARSMLGPRAPESEVIELRQRWGLDEPLPVQFGQFVGRLARGDLGDSLSYGVPVEELIAGRVLPTLLLIFYAVVLVSLISIPLAALVAANKGSWIDHLVRVIPLVGLGMPSFWLAIILILLLALRLGWFPVGGYGRTPTEILRALFLPGLTIAIAIAPFTIRSLRAALLDVLESDFIDTARAKGLSERRVLLAHGMRNAVIPTVTVLGVSIGWLVGNTLIVEKVFAIPGLGALMIDAVLERDFPVVQALALIFGILVVVVNLVADLVRAALDPRIKLA